jgi:hypothetical protein
MTDQAFASIQATVLRGADEKSKKRMSIFMRLGV